MARAGHEAVGPAGEARGLVLEHGRPFLTNAGETLFLFVPLLLVHRRERTGPGLGLACGLSLGIAALYKSFFLVVPGTFTLPRAPRCRAHCTRISPTPPAAAWISTASPFLTL